MKNGYRTSVLLALACLIALSAESRAAAKPYIGLYVDATHSIDRQDIPAPYMEFTAWVWVLPSYNGMICTDFKLAAPDWLLEIGITANPGNSVISGWGPFGADGVSMCFPSCRTDWTWLYQLRMLPVTANVPGYIEFVEYVEHHDKYDLKYPLCGNCVCATWPLESACVLNKLGLNQDALIGTDNSSWGAIKSIYREP